MKINLVKSFYRESPKTLTSERINVREDQLFRLFREKEVRYYDFSKSPELVTKKTENPMPCFSDSDLSRWETAQKSFLQWTRQTSVYTREYVDTNYKRIGSFFDKRGLFTGNVLDVGGGWGVMREWWDPTNDDIYVVHDPGVERFLRRPHEYLFTCYKRGFSLPISFVEGYGEELPYADGSFDVCLIAATLDHVIAPEKVIRECFRCLKPSASLILIQTTKRPPKSLAVYLKSIVGRTGDKLFHSIFSADHHLSAFFLEDLLHLLSQNGFSITLLRQIDEFSSVYALEARKE